MHKTIAQLPINFYLNLVVHNKIYVVMLALTISCVRILILWAGVEARGFIFGPPIALAIGAKFVPIRKPKKLPGIGLLSYIYIFVLLVVFSFQTSKTFRNLN